VARLGQIGRCLDEAIQQLVSEDTKHTTTASVSSSAKKDDDESYLTQEETTENQPRKRRRSGSNQETNVNAENENKIKKIPFDESIKKSILAKFGESVASSWSKTNNKEGKNPISHSPGAAVINNPPAALLQGKVRFFNRLGGNWRIIVTDAQIRPRVNFDSKRKKRGNYETLWERSVATGGNKEENNDGDGGNVPTVHVEGDMQILAFDDKC